MSHDTGSCGSCSQRARIQLHTYNTGAGTVSQRTRLTANQRSILELPELPRYYQFEPLDDYPPVSAPHGSRRRVVTRDAGPSAVLRRHARAATSPWQPDP
jgi:hypothetical protein